MSVIIIIFFWKLFTLTSLHLKTNIILFTFLSRS